MMGGMGFLMLVGGLLVLALPVALIALVVVLVMQATNRREPMPSAAAQSGTLAPVPMGQIAARRVCPNCGQAVAADWSHCAHCGGPLGAQSA
jgi:hypothetical protein